MEQSKKISLVLCILLGYLGVHKFYEKKYGLGVLYLLTFGLFGIGWITDCVKLFLAVQCNSKEKTELQSVQSANCEGTDCLGTTVEKTYKVAGINHYLSAFKSIGEHNPQYDMSKKEILLAGLAGKEIYKQVFNPQKAEVIPEPDNPHDQNAIKVIIDGVHIGYIKAGSCAHLLKVITENRIEQICCEMRGGQYKAYVDTSGMDEDAHYELDEGDSPYWAILHITERKA